MSAVSEQLQRLATAIDRLEQALHARIEEADQLDRAALEAEIENRVEDRLATRLAAELEALRAGEQADRASLARQVDDAIARLESVLDR